MGKYKQPRTIEYSFLDAAGKTVYLSALMTLCFYSALWMIQDIFPDWQISQLAVRWICAFVVLTTAVYEIGIRAMPWYQWLCRLLAPLFYGAAVYRYVRPQQVDFEDGLCALGTQFLEKFNKQMKTSITIWRGKTELMGMAFAVCMFGVVLALLLLALILETRFFLLLPAFVLETELLIGYAPQWKGVSCFFACVLTAFAGKGDMGRIHLRIRSGGQKRGAFAGLWRLFPPLCTAAAALLVLAGSSALFERPAARFMKKAPEVREFQRNLEQNIEIMVSGLFERSKVNVQNRPPQYTGREVLKITASKEPAEDLYLKDFYGTDYRDGRWVCDRQAFADACQKAGYSQQKAAEELVQAEYDVLLESLDSMSDSLSKVVSTGPAPNKIREMLLNVETDYTLEYSSIWNKHAYMPYLIDLSQSRTGGRLSGDTIVQKSWGQKKTEISGLNYDMDSYLIRFAGSAAEREVFQWYDTFANEAYIKESGQIPAVGEYMERIYAAATGLMIPDGEFLEIFENAQVWMEQTDRAGRNQIRVFLADYIGMLLKETLRYSLDLQPLPAGEDAVNYFLTESHEGFCVHFASAAVLMLRQQGVPARYVSGYVVRKEDFHKSDGVYTASVKDNAAHAWAEIYLDGIGWLPVDVTPGDSAHVTDAANGQQTSSEEKDKQENKESVESTQPDDTQPDDTKTDTDTDDTKTDTDTDDTKTDDGQTDREKAGDWMKDKLGWIFVAVLILLSSCAIRSGIRRYHNVLIDDLRAGRNRSAVLRLNRRLYRGLIMRGKIHRRAMTDAEYEQVLKGAYPDVPEEAWARYMQIVRAAAFSGEELDTEDARFCYHIYRNLRKKSREQ